MIDDLEMLEYKEMTAEEKMSVRLRVAEEIIAFAGGKTVAPGGEEVIQTPSPNLNLSRSARVTKAVIPVAGLGTRFLPATKSIPKEMMTLVDRPLIQYAIDEGRAAGIQQFIFVTSRGKSALEDYFDKSLALEQALVSKGKLDLAEVLSQTNMASGAAAFVRQQDPLGLGHAVWCAREFVAPGEPFAVILPDDVIAAEKPCLQQLMEAHQEVGGSIVATMEVPADRISSFGALDIGEDAGALLKIRGLVEKPRPEDSPSNLAVVGRYILDQSVLENLDSLKPGVGGEIQLTDGIAQEIAQGRPVFGFRFRGQRFDCGSKTGFIQATIAFGLAREDLQDEISAFLHDLVNLSDQRDISEIRNVVNFYDHIKSKAV